MATTFFLTEVKTGHLKGTVACKAAWKVSLRIVALTVHLHTVRCYPVFELRGCAFSPSSNNLRNFATNKQRFIASAESIVTSVMPDFICCYIFFYCKRAKLKIIMFAMDMYPEHRREYHSQVWHGVFFNFLNPNLFVILPWDYTDCKSSGTNMKCLLNGRVQQTSWFPV